MTKSLVLLLAGVSVALAGGMKYGQRSQDEIEEFKNFLDRSTQGAYQEPATPELEHLQNYWERSGKFEGDIILSEEQKEAHLRSFSGARNAVIATSQHWPGKTVYYALKPDTFTDAQESAIVAGLKDISSKSCIVFKKRTSEPNYVFVTGKPDGCYSRVGFAGGEQNLNLARAAPGTGCFRHGTIVHEFLHAIGFYHMQSTYNRDDFVHIVWDKILKGYKNNFNKYTSSEVDNEGVEYDYGSVLHYSQYSFSNDGNKTIIPLKATGLNIGQRVGMSAGDIVKLNKLYSCH